MKGLIETTLNRTMLVFGLLAIVVLSILIGCARAQELRGEQEIPRIVSLPRFAISATPTIVESDLKSKEDAPNGRKVSVQRTRRLSTRCNFLYCVQTQAEH